VLRCHIEAFEHLGGAARVLYDRMKTAALGELAPAFPSFLQACTSAHWDINAVMAVGRM
jgi:hypothetical protein